MIGTSRIAILTLLTTGLASPPFSAQSPSGDPVTIHVLDVGQGASALIRTPHGKWAVIDGGPSRYLADSAIPRYNVDRFALAVLSHRHSDHLTGLLHAFAKAPTDVFVADTSDGPSVLRSSLGRFKAMVRERELPVRTLRPDTFDIDGVRFIIIPSPVPGDPLENNRSIIVRLEYGQFSMLFPGDAEANERAALVAHAPRLMRSSVLMASFHGSRNGTSPEWLAAVSPSAIVIPVGDGSRFPLPNGPAVDSYIRLVGENRVYCTNRQGTILVFGYPDGRSAVRPEKLKTSPCAFEHRTTGPNLVVIRNPHEISYTAVYTVPSTAGGSDRHLRPHVVTNLEGIQFFPAERLFRGTFLFGLIDSSSRQSTSRLAVPVRAQLASSDGVSPAELLVEHVNVPFLKVTVTSETPGDSVRVQVIPDIDPAGLSVTLPVRQTVVADVSPKRIQGFGLQTALVGVRLAGGSLDSVEADVAPDQGIVTNRRVMLHRGRAQDVTVRSSGVGLDSIRIISVAGRDVIALQYQWPLRFLLAAIGGGCIGVFARRWRKRTFKVGLRDVLNGVFVGLMAAVGYALGVNLLKVEIPLQGFNEAAVLLAAAVATFAGLNLTPKSRG